jgi:translation initiation factor 1 (eIF-1/SUI1)
MSDHDDGTMTTPLTTLGPSDSCGPAVTLDHDTLVDVAMQSSARYASYGTRVQFERANECMRELKRRLACGSAVRAAGTTTIQGRSDREVYDKLVALGWTPPQDRFTLTTRERLELEAQESLLAHLTRNLHGRRLSDSTKTLRILCKALRRAVGGKAK